MKPSTTNRPIESSSHLTPRSKKSTQQNNHLGGLSGENYESFREAVRNLNRDLPQPDNKERMLTGSRSVSIFPAIGSTSPTTNPTSSSPFLNDWMWKCEVLENQNVTLKADAEKMKTEIEELRRSVSETREAVTKNFEAEMAQLEQLLQTRNERILDLESKLKVVSTENHALSDQSHQLQQQVECLRKEIKINQEYVQRARHASEREAILEFRLSETEAKNLDLTTAVKRLGSEINFYQSEVEKLRLLEAKFRTDPKAESELVQHFHSQIEQLAAKADEHLRMYEDNTEALKREYEGQLEDLRQQLQSAGQSKASAEADRRVIRAMEQEIRTLRLSAQTEQQRRERETDFLRDQLKDTEAALAQSQKQNRDLEASTHRLRFCDAEISQLVKRLGRTDSELQNALNRVTELEGELGRRRIREAAASALAMNSTTSTLPAETYRNASRGRGGPAASPAGAMPMQSGFGMSTSSGSVHLPHLHFEAALDAALRPAF